MLLVKGAQTLRQFVSGTKHSQGDEFVKVCLIVDGKQIKKMTVDESETKEFDYDQVIDASGLTLLPGLIDPQVHFREPGGEAKEDLETGSFAAAAGGFTTVITMPNTNPTTDNAQVVSYLLKRASEVGLCRILPTASVTKDLKGLELTNFDELKKAGIIALTDDGKGIQSDEVMLEAMKRAKLAGLAILDHSEDESLSLGGAIHQSSKAKENNVKGIDPMSEAVHVKRGCEYSLKTGCHFHVLHISTKESIQFVREAKAKGANVTCEVSPHHLLLSVDDIPLRENGERGLDANFKMNPPLRSLEDKIECEKALLDGTIDFIATDHAPHTQDEKSKPIEQAPFGIVGLETAFTLMYTHFVKTNKMSLSRLIELMSSNAAKVFDLPYGTLEDGKPADFVLVDLGRQQRINVQSFKSKGKNSPFHGWECFGVPMLTGFEGKIVYDNGVL